MDFTEVYGVMLTDLLDRPWPIVREHIFGLLSVDSRISRALRN